jgi:hypothetical protein
MLGGERRGRERERRDRALREMKRERGNIINRMREIEREINKWRIRDKRERETQND